MPNESGILNIDIQVRYYKDDRTMIGILDLRIASYSIYNISDDKPKFLIQKISDGI
jgi:hypothetical protein